MGDKTTQASNDLTRWLKMLALPAWARFALGWGLMLIVLFSAVRLLFGGLLQRQPDVILQNFKSSVGEFQYQDTKIQSNLNGRIADYALSASASFVGILLIQSLGNDFLLNPVERLYFTQSLAFFVPSPLTVELTHG